MSRKVIHDIIIPIVQRLLSMNKLYGEAFSEGIHDVSIDDKNLEEFLEAQLIREFQVAGEVGGRCAQLEFLIKEYMQRDPLGLEQLIERLLNLYIKLRLQGEEQEDGPQWGELNPWMKNRKKQRKPLEMVPVV